MSKLTDALRAHLDARGLTQKDVAAALHQALERLGPPHAIAWSTAETKLSKLLGGHPEGVRFFFDEPVRLTALAGALGLPEAELRAMNEVRTLVLHPDLPLLAAGYLRTRAESPGARHDVAIAIAPSSPAATLVALRDAALRSPGAIVVVPEHSDVRFFSEQGVQTTTLRKEPRGLVLVAEPDLVPLPPAPAPDEWLSDDRPLFLCPALVEHLLNLEKNPQRGSTYSDRPSERFANARRLEQTPTFTFEELAGFRGEAASEQGLVLGKPPGLDAIVGSTPDASAATHVWAWKRRVFAVGPNVGGARALLGGGDCPHAFETPSSLDLLRTAFDQWNPWTTLPESDSCRGASTFSPLAEPSRWNALKAEVAAECGVALETLLHPWWQRARDFDPAQPLPARPRASTATRAALRELAGRDLHLDVRFLHVAFRLQVAAEAPLMEIEPTRRERFHVIANMGAGHLLRIQCLHYPHEQPTALRGHSSLLVGGDVTLLLSDLAVDVMLEGSGVSARRRRKRREKDGYDSSSDWDD